MCLVLGEIPINPAKYADLQHLAKFCGQKAKDYFKKLRH